MSSLFTSIFARLASIAVSAIVKYIFDLIELTKAEKEMEKALREGDVEAVNDLFNNL